MAVEGGGGVCVCVCGGGGDTGRTTPVRFQTPSTDLRHPSFVCLDHVR